MPRLRLCAEILSTGTQCTQFALRNQPWCHNHADPRRRARNNAARQLIAIIPAMDLFDVTLMLWNTVFELQRKVIPPRHAYAIFEAALFRLNQLLEEAHAAGAFQTPGASG
jgi:hypothetical protein